MAVKEESRKALPAPGLVLCASVDSLHKTELLNEGWIEWAQHHLFINDSHL